MIKVYKKTFWELFRWKMTHDETEIDIIDWIVLHLIETALRATNQFSLAIQR